MLYQMDNFCIGRRVKDEMFTTLEGETVSLRCRSGKVALVDVWSTGCTPCKRKLPELMELQKGLEGKSFEVITLNVDKNRDTLDAFLKEPEFAVLQDDMSRSEVDEQLRGYMEDPRVTLPVVHVGLRSPLLRLWDIRAFPTLFLLDGDGIMRGRGHVIPYDDINGLVIGASVQPRASLAEAAPVRDRLAPNEVQPIGQGDPQP